MLQRNILPFMSSPSGGGFDKTGLISYFECEESGTLIDSHGSNNMARIGTTGQAAGIVGNAISTSGSGYASVDSNSTLQTGDIDFSFFGWLYLNTISTWNALGGKGRFSVPGDTEYIIEYTTSGGNGVRFGISTSGSFKIIKKPMTLSTSTWYFLVGIHDSINNLVKLSVNASAFTESAWSAGVTTNALPFQLLAENGYGIPSGRADQAGFIKRALSLTEVEWLYNSGSGRAYSEL